MRELTTHKTTQTTRNDVPASGYSGPVVRRCSPPRGARAALSDVSSEAPPASGGRGSTVESRPDTVGWCDS